MAARLRCFALTFLLWLVPHNAGNAEPCSDCAKKKLQKPGSIEALLSAVRKNVTAGKYSEAEAAARKAQLAAGRNLDQRARALSELGYALSCQKKYPEAITAYDQSLRLRLTRVKTVAEMDSVAAELQNLAGLQRRVGLRPAARKSMDTAADVVAKAHGNQAEVTQLFRNAARAFPRE